MNLPVNLAHLSSTQTIKIINVKKISFSFMSNDMVEKATP